MNVNAATFLGPYDAVLFDIDGTLLNCRDAVHYFAFCEALTSLAGKPLDLEGVATQGNVDEGILRDALLRAGIPENLWRPGLRGACEGMCQFVNAHAHELDMDVLPGVLELLPQLKASGKFLGTSTGNLGGIGRAKLEHSGLLPFFDFGGFSDGCDTRTEVFRRAVVQARALAGPAARICVIGDTPADIRAAHENALAVIAVATGIFSFETLAAERPDLCLHTLSELLHPAAQS